MKRIALAALLAVSTSAFAFHCPMDMKKIDEAMAKNPQLTPEQTAEVKKYRAEGESLLAASRTERSCSRSRLLGALRSDDFADNYRWYCPEKSGACP